MKRLTKKAKEYLYSVYGREAREKGALAELFVDLPCELVIEALNYAAECDEAHPDHDFIAGALWAMKTDFEPMSTTQSLNKENKE